MKMDSFSNCPVNKFILFHTNNEFFFQLLFTQQIVM